MQSKYNIILASKSPRRQYLVTELGLPFIVKTKDTDESFPHELKREEIPLYLCKKKADAFYDDIADNDLVITADTIVWINEHVMNKPESRDEAVEMLTELSDTMHQVYTGVCLKSKNKEVVFYDKTDVYFKSLTIQEIDYYIDNFKPYDKAGAYGAQEWIGYIGVEKIVGSYFNVMGLPVNKLYNHLLDF